MARAGLPDSPRVGWLHPNRIARWAILACVVASLSGVVSFTAKQSPPLVGPPIPSDASEVMGLSLSRERPLWMRRAVPDQSPSASSTGHIRIPAIEVDAPLIPRGLAPDGTLDVPRDWGVAGWFDGGPFPGERGPAVVVGHVDSTSGPAVFYRLRELQRGDEVVVWREGYGRSHFRVESLRWFPKSDFPTELVYGATVGSTLRLITCGGAFDQTAGHYLDNLVVFASPVTDP
jgi:LPXTG-site transpeptidase (sortase) family protein